MALPVPTSFDLDQMKRSGFGRGDSLSEVKADRRKCNL